jgi:dihydrofolate reductase
MRNIISLAHMSLDGFLAAPGGNMDIIVFNDELADHTYPLIETVDLAVYGRITYELMQGYWPNAADAPDANAHTKSHAGWYKGVKKIVASRTLPVSKDPNVRVIGADIAGALRAEKQNPGGDIMTCAPRRRSARASSPPIMWLSADWRRSKTTDKREQVLLLLDARGLPAQNSRQSVGTSARPKL